MQLEKRQILVGHYYKHFKGNIYLVVGIATHSETGEDMVVYQSLYGDHRLFVRPYQMFAEALDPKRYPYAKQKYRFELVS